MTRKLELKAAEEKARIPIEEVNITIKDGDSPPQPVHKRYVAKYEFDSGIVALSACAIHYPPTKQWWACVGKKDESGVYICFRTSSPDCYAASYEALMEQFGQE